MLRSFAFFRQIFKEIARDYPDIEPDYLYVDAAAQALVLEPDRFDVIVTENMFGDILSDLGGVTVGGIGVCAGANIGDEYAYFEPIHGSASALAGKGLANPLATILSAGLMLNYLGRQEAFENLQVYQLSEKLADGIWDVVGEWGQFAKDTIGKQMVRSADSIGANIAEGTGRGSFQDNRRFVKIARGSLQCE